MTPPTRVVPCPDPDPNRKDTRRPEDCPDLRQDVAQGADQPRRPQAPLTEGRQFVEDTEWNIWFAIGPYTDTVDRRHGLDNGTQSNYFTFGADRHFGPRIVAGASVNLDGYGGSYRVAGEGITAGPHIAYRMSEAWTADATVSVAWYDNDTNIDLLSGNYASRRHTGAFNFTGQYQIDRTSLRPKLSGSFTYSTTDSYDLNGTFAGSPVLLPLDAARSKYGEATGGVEFSYLFRRFIPYLEISTRYEYLRANDGQIMTGDLTLATMPGWTGMTRFGGRLLLGGTTFLEVGGGYLSFFQRGLAAWETRVFLSQGF